MNKVSNEQVKEFENELNNRPRKGLNFMTANEVMKLALLD